MADQNILNRNRNNAQHSTGPKTEAGKSRSSQNARKHGFTARSAWSPADFTEDQRQFFHDYYTRLKPDGPVEATVFDQIVHAAWNLRLIAVALDELAAEFGCEEVPQLLNLPDLPPDAERRYDRLLRYQGRNQRAFHTNMRLLASLQTNRVAADVTGTPGQQPLSTVSALLDIPKIVRLTNRSQPEPPGIAPKARTQPTRAA